MDGILTEASSENPLCFHESMHLQAILSLLALGILLQAIAWLFITDAQPSIPTARSGLILLLQPALATVWGVLFIDYKGKNVMRLGLCCAFIKENIRFKTTRVQSVEKLNPFERLIKIKELAQHNAEALYAAVDFCSRSGIGCFRVTSQILPLKTHPTLGYESSLLGTDIIQAFRSCRISARKKNIRLSFHPDQFVVLNSPDPAVVKSSIVELEYQAEVAEWIGADVINIHAGGGYGDKPASLKRLIKHVGLVSDRVRARLALENDDRIYAPSDLAPVCKTLSLPMVYDVHHHRCLQDGLDVKTATEMATKTWNREPLFHNISSPRGGPNAANPRNHSDYINLWDFPRIWDTMNITVEVEAKAKELAVLKLVKALAQRKKRYEIML